MLDIQRAEKTGLDLAERGKAADGTPIRLDTRLFVRLLAFTDCLNPAPLVEALDASGVTGVLYTSAHDPRGVAVITFTEDPDTLLEQNTSLFATTPFRDLTPLPAFTMLGRTYSIGYEHDLEDTLVGRPVRTMTNPDWPWAIWYPLRRKGSFEELSAEEQRTLLMEHGGIGRAYGKADHAHDVRLSCHGLDVNDNDFIAGLMGKTLHPLSAVVQHMRRTKQTSQHMEKLGPFFVGKAIWQRAGR